LDSIEKSYLDSSGGPEAGFGSLWRKTFRIELGDIDLNPKAVVSFWKSHFGDFWPGNNSFNAPIAGLRKGEVAEIELVMPGGTALSTGVRLIRSNDQEFTLLAPPGHVFCGWTNFSSFAENGKTVAQVEVLMRASDPLFEIGLMLFGHRQENQFWLKVLENLGRFLGSESVPTQSVKCLDRRFRFRNASNIRYNAVLRNGPHLPGRGLRRLLARRRSQKIAPE
jgi:hypothetical protein